MIQVDTRDSLSVIRLEHGKVNALDVELCESLSAQLDALASAGTKAIVLTGTGKAFSAGVDLFRLLNEGDAYLDRFLVQLCTVLEKLFLFPKPVVAAVNGHAIAGGCILACACDCRIMARGSSTIGVTELRVGVPFPAVALAIVRSAVAPQYLQEIAYTGRTYAGEDALRRGLIDEIVEPEALMDRAFEVAASYGEVPGESFRITKQQLRRPALEQAAAEPLTGEIHKQWASAEIHAVIRSYLQKTIGKK